MDSPQHGRTPQALRPLENLLTRLESTPVTAADPAEVEALLAAGSLVTERDTRLAGPLRVIHLADAILIAERSLDGQPVVRRVPDLEHAERLLEDRLATYERMWDGCGCRVDYYR